MVEIFSKEDLIKKLTEIKELGWIKSGRHGNDDGVGNTLEDLLGIDENNLPIPNATEWELKTQRRSTTSLTTLFHMEPSPQGAKIVSQILLPLYGWPHQKAGMLHPKTEISFRSTTSALAHTSRGFIVVVDRKEKKVKLLFDASRMSKEKHTAWLTSVKKRVGLGELNPQPYWGFKDLMYKAGSKLKNAFYVIADTERRRGKEFFAFNEAHILSEFNFDGFLDCIEDGTILIDFDARTGHNHGTKFRIRQNNWPRLYKSNIRVF